MTIRVLLASDARLTCEGLERMLREIERINLLDTAPSAEDAVERVRALSPDVVLLDMSMQDAFFAAKQIARISRSIKVVALGMPEIESEVITCAEIGIAGYVTRDGALSDVVAAIDAAARGEVHCSPRIAGSLFRRIAVLSTERRNASPVAGLTAREAQVLRLLQQGLSNKMISRNLGIEVPTVKHHVHSILTKLGVHRRTEAVLLLNRRMQSQQEHETVATDTHGHGS